MKKRDLFMATAVLCLAGNMAAGQTKAETVSQEKQAYEYSKEDENGNTVNETITDEQIAALGKSLGVPEDITITRCNVSEPWFWEGAGRWLVSVELYSDDTFLAGAAIDPDTLELQREIAPYDAGRIEKEKQEAALSKINSSDMEVANGLIQVLVSGDGSAFLKLLPELPTEYREAFGDKMIAVFTGLVQDVADEAVQEFQEEFKDSQLFYQALSSEDVDSETLAELQKSYAEFGCYVTAARLVHEELSEDGATSYLDIPVVEIDGKWYLDLKSWDDDDSDDDDGDCDDDDEEDEDFEELLEEGLEARPFYGIWCYASKDSDEAENYAEYLESVCEEPEVLLSSDWSNLNSEPYYVVTAGRYETEEEAEEALDEVQSVCDGAYVKYSGEYQG